jgi:hypothetical protein
MQQYFEHSRKIDEVNGRIIPYQTKGVTVYITLRENRTLDYCKLIEVVLGGYVILYLIYDRNERPRPV